MEFLKTLSEQRKIIVFGELGSGKTELSMSLAVGLREETGRRIRLMDMDQTKPMYRARDIRELLTARGIELLADEQFMDAPTVSPGIRERMEDEIPTIMDVGGSFHGALCMGQFAEIIQSSEAMALYVINPYRPFSDTAERIRQTMTGILSCCHLEKVSVVSNPFIGGSMSIEQLTEENEALRLRLEPLGLSITAVAVPALLYEAALREIREPVFPVTGYLQYVLNPCAPDSVQ